MTSIDDLFKKPNLPGKRKFESPSSLDPTSIYKSAKISANGSPSNGANGKASTVEDSDEDLGNDAVAGPTLPPEDEDVPDDEDGRFFGGGITNDEREVLDFIDSRDGGGDEGDAGEEVIDVAWLRKMALGFEKKISRNAELRAKFEGVPTKFMASEADLDADVKAISILSEHTKLYSEFASLGCVGSLVSLLAHENTDIAIDAIEILGELIDEDVEVEASQWEAVVNAMLDADVINLLTENLARLDETNESDRSGVYHVLSVVENLASQPDIAERIGQTSNMLQWLLARIQRKDEGKIGQNMQYTAEILTILLQSAEKNRAKFCSIDGVDVILQLLSTYRKRDPEKGSDEEEYVENLFDCLTCVVDDEEGKKKFLDAEGVELCQIMMREGKMSKARALRVLDHAFGGLGSLVCERFVEAAGLKTIFGMFMKKQEKEATEHLLGMFASLLRLLPGESAVRVRTLAKFVEKDYEKIAKLVQLRTEYAAKVGAVDKEIAREEKEMNAEERTEAADEWLSRRFDEGLFTLQTTDVILAWLMAEDGGARKRVEELMGANGEGVEVLKTSLQQQLDSATASGGGQTTNDTDVLIALLRCL